MTNVDLLVQQKPPRIEQAVGRDPVICRKRRLPQCPVPEIIAVEMFGRRSAHGREPRMNKKMPVTVLIIREHPPIEGKMPAKLRRSNARITGHRGCTAMKQPIAACTPPCQPLLAPGIMIPLDEDTVVAI